MPRILVSTDLGKDAIASAFTVTSGNGSQSELEVAQCPRKGAVEKVVAELGV
jgi:hypothetical protein